MIRPVIEKSIFERWIKALRSGKYKQEVGILKSMYRGHAKFCCLGLLCEIAGLKWLEFGQSENSGTQKRKYMTENHKATLCPVSYLPNAFQPKKDTKDMSWVGIAFNKKEVRIPESVPDHKITDITDTCKMSLAGLNDVAQLSFEQIADFVELNRDQLVEIVQ